MYQPTDLKYVNLFQFDVFTYKKFSQLAMKYSVSSLVVPKVEEGISGTGAVKNSKWPDKSW